MRAVFDSSEIPVRERVEAWETVVASSLIPTEIDSPRPGEFTARLGTMSLGTAQVSSMAYAWLSARRSARNIRQLDPEYYQVGLIRAGRQGIEQHHASVLLHPGELVIYDSSQPFEAVATGMAPSRTAVLHFPKRLLPLPARQVDRLCATAIPGTGGIGRLLAQFLVSLTDDPARYTQGDARRLGHTAIDLTTAVLAHHLERDRPSLRSPSHILYLRVVAFIEQHLHRPDLRPAAIAAAHRISLRYLHRIFEQHHHSSVNTHIRTRRLDRARRELVDPRLDHLTIAAIAARSGYSRPADFTRAFHRYVGMPPRDYRVR